MPSGKIICNFFILLSHLFFFLVPKTVRVVSLLMIDRPSRSFCGNVASMVAGGSCGLRKRWGTKALPVVPPSAPPDFLEIKPRRQLLRGRNCIILQRLRVFGCCLSVWLLIRVCLGTIRVWHLLLLLGLQRILGSFEWLCRLSWGASSCLTLALKSSSQLLPGKG